MSEFQASKQKSALKPINDELLILEVKRCLESFKSLLSSLRLQKEKFIIQDVVIDYGIINLYLIKLMRIII